MVLLVNYWNPYHGLKGIRITTIPTNEGPQQSKYFGQAIYVINKAANPDKSVGKDMQGEHNRYVEPNVLLCKYWKICDTCGCKATKCCLLWINCSPLNINIIKCSFFLYITVSFFNVSWVFSQITGFLLIIFYFECRFFKVMNKTVIDSRWTVSRYLVQ